MEKVVHFMHGFVQNEKVRRSLGRRILEPWKKVEGTIFVVFNEDIEFLPVRYFVYFVRLQEGVLQFYGVKQLELEGVGLHAHPLAGEIESYCEPDRDWLSWVNAISCTDVGIKRVNKRDKTIDEVVHEPRVRAFGRSLWAIWRRWQDEGITSHWLEHGSLQIEGLSVWWHIEKDRKQCMRQEEEVQREIL